MYYQITITRTEKNTNFKEEMAQWIKDRNSHGRWGGETIRPEPQPHVVENVLMVELTEAQFKAVKAAVFKEFGEDPAPLPTQKQ